MDGTILNKKYKLEDRVTALEESTHDLPVASADTLGGVKLGERLSITEDGVLSANSQLVNYSTNEQATGQKWIDGNDIYFRTFTGLTLTTTSNWQDTGIDSTGVDTILGGFAVDDSKQSIVCSFGFGTNSTVILRAYMSTNVIKTITLFYTKTPPVATKKSKK